MTSSFKRYALWTIAAIVIIAGVLVMVRVASKNNGNAQPTPANVAELSTNDWTQGNKSSTIVMVEYADFQCPACGAYHPLLKQLKQEMGSQMLFVFRNYPLLQHANAKPAAYAAGAAGKQGKFWEMHNMLFENQQAWSDSKNPQEIFVGYAQQLGLNVDQFKTDVDANDVKQKVADDYASGDQAGVPGTPTFFVNGQKLPSPRSYDEFKQLIQYVANNS